MTEFRDFAQRFDNPERFDTNGVPSNDGILVSHEDFLELRRVLIGTFYALGISAEAGIKALLRNSELESGLRKIATEGSGWPVEIARETLGYKP